MKRSQSARVVLQFLHLFFKPQLQLLREIKRALIVRKVRIVEDVVDAADADVADLIAKRA
jgi:hypothetical protein